MDSHIALASSPKADTCLAHLKLLFAFRRLRLEIGFEDGLWGICDSRVKENLPNASPEERDSARAKLREKRWAVFLARAVHRYETWWNSLEDDPLTESDMEDDLSTKYALFATHKQGTRWKPDTLVPLDVLMVWHTHMLNPRLYLEDTMRRGLGSLWASGLPFELIAGTISSDFEYMVSEECRQSWTQRTGLAWDNVFDNADINIACPNCEGEISVPWTTCTSGQVSSSPGVLWDGHDRVKPPSDDILGIIGRGYGDGQFRQDCPHCSIGAIDAERLTVYKFIRDCKNLVAHGWTMPGTVLAPYSSMPEKNGSMPKANAALTSPNRLVRILLQKRIEEMVDWEARQDRPPTMEDVVGLVEYKIKAPGSLAMLANTRGPFSKWFLGLGPDGSANSADTHMSSHDDQKLSRKASIVMRKMMAQYGGKNFSPFALDLKAAVVRQSLFIDKMYKFDWLHSPNATSTMTRLLDKYDRFLHIARDNSGEMVVPTLDVDLAWHTHQLNPKRYYAFTTLVIGKLLDHDDKIDENKLSTSFDWMCRTYEKRHGEVYSECMCWYCEAIRCAGTSTLSIVLGRSNKQKLYKQFHAQHGSQPSLTETGPHISAHNAVKVPAQTIRDVSLLRLYEQHKTRREIGRKRAELMAKKHGLRDPDKLQSKLRRESHTQNGQPWEKPQNEKKQQQQQQQHPPYDHWGFPFYLTGPWMCALFLDPDLYGSNIAEPSPTTGINAEGVLGGCVTGCGNTAMCTTTAMSVTDLTATYGDVTESDVIETTGGDSGGGDGGGCGGGCGG